LLSTYTWLQYYMMHKFVANTHSFIQSPHFNDGWLVITETKCGFFVIIVPLWIFDIYMCDQACENRACGHKLHPSFNRPFLSNGKEYLCAVTCTIQLIEFGITVENFMAIGYQYKKFCFIKVWKSSQTLCAHMPCFYRPSHIFIIYYQTLQYIFGYKNINTMENYK